MSLSESERHSREFMLKAVERLEAGERASALAIELNLNRTIIYHWRDRFRANGAEALTSNRGRPRRHVLERAAESDLRHAIARQAGDTAPAQPDLARLAAIDVADAVEERGLARSIGPDQATDLARRHIERDVIECRQAAETDHDVAHFEQRPTYVVDRRFLACAAIWRARTKLSFTMAGLARRCSRGRRSRGSSSEERKGCKRDSRSEEQGSSV